YGFGAILYECLSGRTAFVGAGYEIMHQSLHKTPDRPSVTLAARLGADAAERGFRIPETLEALCMSCLERDPDRRPFSLEDVAATLEAWNAPAPSAPPPPPKPPTLILRPTPFPRPSRRQLPVLSGAFVLALLGLGFLLHFLLAGDAGDIARF